MITALVKEAVAAGARLESSCKELGILMAKLARADVLVVDDWGLTPAGEQERRDFFEILEDRYGNRSTIMTSQLPPKDLARSPGRPDPGRRHPRPHPPQRPPARAKGAFQAHAREGD